MARILLSLLDRCARAESDADFVEALLQAWAHVAEADYYSLARRFEATGKVEFWHPGEGRLGPEHPLMKSFAKLWATENPMETHPCVAAFLKNGPGAYLRSALERDSVWRRRAHFRIVDKPMGIADMVSVFLTPSNGTLVILNSGSSGRAFPSEILKAANEFAQVSNSLLVARGGFAEKPPAPSSENLSAREIEVLVHVGEGKKNPEIARELGLSVHTVRKHLENIYAKLGVETRTAALAVLHAAGRKIG
jgi:DNA-binding CsgD family transcriptional regulator